MEVPGKQFSQKIIFIVAAILSLFPFISPPIALAMGLFLAQVMEHPYADASQKAAHLLLKLSVIGLGFGMNISSLIKAGGDGLSFTILSVSGVLTAGYLLGQMLKIDVKTSSLIAAGMAICGGSAIAALSPVIKANEKQISVALGTIFILNSIALYLFPFVGRGLHLSQAQFGLWCAVSIQDTSSVVAAASSYGEHALQIATTVKLARSLWIIPVSLLTGYCFQTDKARLRMPYFIGFFILAIFTNTYVPFIVKAAPHLVSFAKTGLSLTLFLIGSGLSFKKLKGVGLNPLIQGATLWIGISIASLCAILAFA